MGAEASRQPLGFYEFLRLELRPNAGRVRSVLRMALACSLTVVLAMVFQVPLPAYMAYVVLLISRDEVAGTLVTALGGLAAASLAVALSLLFYIVDASEPALRIVLLAASTFTGIFVARTFALGPIVFLGAFVLVLSQTLLDDVPSPEVMTHFVLWLWMVVAIPVVVTVVINLAVGTSPVVALRQRTREFTDELASRIEAGASAPLGRCGESLAAIMALLPRAQSWDRSLKPYDQADRQVLSTLAEILMLTRLPPQDTSSGYRLAFANCLRASVGRWMTASDRDPVARPYFATERMDPTEAALAHALLQLDQQITRRETGMSVSGSPSPRPRWIPDAFTNPAHVQFALKVTVAVVAAYVTYTLLVWPGIRTAVTTCFFVALSSLGETMHKLTLRLLGALMGGLLAGLCIVFVIPLLTDIGQLAVLIATAAMVFGWVASSSERIAYAGLQMAFAFFLGVLQDYGPPTDLTVLRDRLVGIFIGNLWMSIVFSALWPVTTATLMRRALTTALHVAANVLAPKPADATPGPLALVMPLVAAERLLPLSWFEWKFSASVRAAVAAAQRTVEAIERVAAAALVLARCDRDAKADALGEARGIEVAWLNAAAGCVAAESGVRLPLPTVRNAGPAGPSDARSRLHEEMRHAAPHL
ncbi:multidrug resistance protein MdtO [Luteibacter sp. W1I16]|uniref:FUSC family protein n=1 Tax=Luteibacter sp. W1I16 TaxID=3373922 RepID=UPI003D1EA553